jgi:hypothetical protein
VTGGADAAGDVARVVLSGRPGGTTHREVGILATLPPALCLIGGLAVLCRVGVPHRTTVDLDVVTRGLAAQDRTLRRLATTVTDPSRYSFDDGVDLDVIEVAPESARQVEEAFVAAGGPTDLELSVVAHTWAHDHATMLDVVAVDEATAEPLVVATGRPVATTLGLVAMKLVVVPLRAGLRSEKRASDLYDLGRLEATGRLTAADLETLPPHLRRVAVERLVDWFVDPVGRDRTYRSVRRFDDPMLDLDDVADAVEELTTA